jgi:hypothetical protein
MNPADQILTAQLTGAARQHARWRPLTADEHKLAAAARGGKLRSRIFAEAAR